MSPKASIVKIYELQKSFKFWMILLFVLCVTKEVVDFFLISKHSEWEVLINISSIRPWENDFIGIITEAIFRFSLNICALIGAYFFLKTIREKKIKLTQLVLWLTLLSSYVVLLQIFNLFLLDLKDILPTIRGFTQYPYVIFIIWISIMSITNLSGLLKISVFKSFFTGVISGLVTHLFEILILLIIGSLGFLIPIENIVKNPNKYAPPHLYRTAHNLYSEGRKDEAMFWFYTGQLRARYDANRSNNPYVSLEVGALNQKFGAPINKYAFNNIENLKSTMTEVVHFVENNQESYDPLWISRKDQSRFTDPNTPQLKPKSDWPSIKKETIKEYQEGFKIVLDSLKKQENEVSLSLNDKKEEAPPSSDLHEIFKPKGPDPEEDPNYFYANKDFIIIGSLENFEAALILAIEAASKLNIELDINDTALEEGQLVNTNEETCKKLLFEGRCYLPRGRYDDGKYISIERSNAYQEFTPGYFILVAGSDFTEENTMTEFLEEVKTLYDDAYIKSTKIFMGSYY